MEHLRAAPDVHQIEIELKARIESMEAVEEALSRFMRPAGKVDKRDEYWEFYGPRASPGGFRFRIRADGERKVVTFKEKSFEAFLEINRETEFSIDDVDAFYSFLKKAGAKFIYEKQKKGSRWESGDGLVAEVVEVPPLGKFLEVECVCGRLDAHSQKSAKSRLMEVLKKCGIEASQLEARPYSQMLGY